MSKTFIGQLILRLQAQGLGEADKVRQAMDEVHRQAKSLAAAPWGANFQNQIGKLGASAQQIHAIRESWRQLHATMDRDNLSAPLRKSHIAAWRIATLGHFTAVKAGAESTAKSVNNLRESLTRMGLVAAGAYTLPYFGGMMGREALTAASDARRVEAEAKFAGLSETERGKIDARADELSARFRMEKAEVFEVLKEASLAMPSTDAALAVSESMVRAQLLLDTLFGGGMGIPGLRAFNKAMDNIEKVTPEEYGFMLERYIKAQQVAGKDLDPEAYAQAIKYARSSGKIFSMEFLSEWLPFIIAESGGSDAGTQLRAAFDQFVVGRASKESQERQRELGIRGDDGRLIGAEQFGQNPLMWVRDVLLPKLKASGVNTEDGTELAAVIGQLTNNRLSSDLLMRALQSMEQYERLVGRMQFAAGLDAADDVQALNPFAAYQGFKDSLKNLSAEVLPMSEIAAGLNGLADAINAFKQKVADGDPTVARIAGAGGVAAATWGAWKIGTMVWSLSTAGVRLNSAAVALHGAAAALGGSAAADGAIGGDGKKGKRPGAGWLGLLGGLGVAYDLLGLDADGMNDRMKANAERDAALNDWLEQRIGNPAKWLDAIRAGDPAVWRHPPVVGTTDPVVGTGRISRDGGAVGAGDPLISLSDLFDFFRSEEISNFEGVDELPGGDRARRYFDNSKDLEAFLKQWAASGNMPENAQRFDSSAELLAFLQRWAASGNMPENGPDTRPAGRFDSSAELLKLIQQWQARGPLPENWSAKPLVDETALAAAEQRVAEAAAAMLEALSITATPAVNTAPLDAALAKAIRLQGVLAALGGTARAVETGLDRQLRRSMADYGVSP